MSQKRSMLVASVVLMFFAQQAAAQFSSIHVAANRARYTGFCPVTIIYTGSINLSFPHPRGFVFNYHWERSDGAKGPEYVIRPRPRQGAVIVRYAWRLGGRGMRYDASVNLVINSGNMHIVQSSPVVHVICRR